jgi:mono/diheme cytochrome c family protein
MKPTKPARARLAALALAFVVPQAMAGDETWAPPNPYRGMDNVLEAGRAAYAEHCASCHGADAVQPNAEGPDLRRLDSFCRRLKDAALKAACLKDVDSYYFTSVLEGKVRAGVVHMPAWKDVLAPESIWAIRSFVETRPSRPPQRRLPESAGRDPVLESP